MGRIDPFPQSPQPGEYPQLLKGVSCPWFSTIQKQDNSQIPQALCDLNSAHLLAIEGSTRGSTPPFVVSASVALGLFSLKSFGNSSAAESNQSLNTERNPEAHHKAHEGLPKVVTNDPAEVSALTIGEYNLKLLFLDP